MLQILSEPIKFEWDKGNIDKNWKKHKILNKEAEQIFLDKNLLVSKDEKHSKVEKRYLCLGKTNKRRELFASFTIRNNKIRIISVRLMNKKERKQYAKNS